MKNIILTENEVRAVKLREEHIDGAVYAMYSLSVCGAQRYVIYVGNSVEGDFGVLDADTDDANTLFESICRCSLSPDHLSDVISDYNHDTKR